jgi:hypothetical protein
MTIDFESNLACPADNQRDSGRVAIPRDARFGTYDPAHAAREHCSVIWTSRVPPLKLGTRLTTRQLSQGGGSPMVGLRGHARSHGFALPVYASWPASPLDHATLGTGWLATPCQAGPSPAGALHKVSAYFMRPPRPSSSGATKIPPSAAQRILAAREHLVKVFHELGSG